MSNSSQGIDVNRMALEGLSQVMDSMDLVKRAWSDFSLATPFTPTLDVGELDKRIRDLRAVEQWLSLNQNMLRSTIQGLEIQRGTLNAFSTVTESFGQGAKSSDGSLAQTFARFAAAAAQKSVAAPAAAEPDGTAATAGMPTAGFDWSPLSMPLMGAFSSAAAAPSAADTAAAQAGGQVPPAGAVAEHPTRPAAGPASAGHPEKAAPVPGMDPLGWWQMLQENFRQIAQAATGQAAASAGASAPAEPRAGTAEEPSGSPGAGTSAGAGGSARARKAASTGKGRKPGDGGRTGNGGKPGDGRTKGGKSSRATRPADQAGGSGAGSRRGKANKAGEQA